MWEASAARLTQEFRVDRYRFGRFSSVRTGLAMMGTCRASNLHFRKTGSLKSLEAYLLRPWPMRLSPRP